MDQTDAGKLAREVDLSATRDNGLVPNQKKRRGDTPRVWEPFSNARYGTALRARDGEWQIDKRPPAVVLHVTYSFYGIFGRGFWPQNLRLIPCSVFRQTAAMEAGIDCKLQSNSI
jgi:hypothetical protein